MDETPNQYHPRPELPPTLRTLGGYPVSTKTEDDLQSKTPVYPRSRFSDEQQDVISDPSFSYDGYQVVRGEYFAHTNEPSITISDYKIAVNTACLRKASSVEYVQVLVNPEKRKLILRPCGGDEKDSFMWCTSKRKPKQITCRVFFAMLVNLLNWNPDYRYKIIGKMVQSQGEFLFVFDLSATEIYQRQIVANAIGNETHKSPRSPTYPEEWKNQFGLPVEEHKKALQVNIFDGYAVFGIKDERKTIYPTVHNDSAKGD